MTGTSRKIYRALLPVILALLMVFMTGCGSITGSLQEQLSGSGSETSEEQEDTASAGDEDPAAGEESDADAGTEAQSQGQNETAGNEDAQADGDSGEKSAEGNAEDKTAKPDEEEISVSDIEGINIGQVENTGAGTGLTVLLSKQGMAAGLDVRGGGPAGRESGLLEPLASAKFIHAIVIAGGSAYGLGAANGVMDYLEENGVGYDTGVAKVPLVAQSDIFDLSVGDSRVRPDAEMGYEAARLAVESPNYKDGNYGAGCGASVGKIAGMDTAMKTGMGSYAIRIGDLKIGAIVALNSLGDVYDWKTGKKIAGLLSEDKQQFRDTTEFMALNTEVKDNKFTGNTAIGVVITNAVFDKTQLCKIAGMTHDGFARSIRPVHTSADGDSIYAVSVGDVKADQDLVGALAAVVMSEAIKNAVSSADSAYGLPSATEIGSVKGN